MNNFNHYNLLGITGIIGCGKSFVAIELKNKYNANVIEIDDIRRYFLWSLKTKEALSLRKELIDTFLIDNYNDEYFFNREIFTNFIFSDISILNKFNRICFPYFINEIKNKLIKDSFNILVWVNLIEDNYVQLTDYVLFIEVCNKRWKQYNSENIHGMKKRLDKQKSNLEKKLLLNNLSIPYEVYNNG